MHKWRAITEIVRSFNERDRPGYALAALVALLLASLAAVALAVCAGSGVIEFLPRQSQAMARHLPSADERAVTRLEAANNEHRKRIAR